MTCRGTSYSLVAALSFTLPLSAQIPAADSLIFARAQRLVAEGDAPAGRALVDSVLALIPVSSPRYAEGLFWHASIASDALDAERDYRRIAVEYSLSPRVPDALTRLAQLELARGDRVLAARHLERLLREYPPPPARATAWYWLARIGFEDSDITRACIALDSARSLAPPLSAASSVELVNQIRFESARCLTRAGTSVSSTGPASARSVPTTSGPVARPPANAGVSYSIQVGAYPARAAAERLHAQLVTQGYAARIVPAPKLFRVRVGRYDSRADAERVAAKLKAARLDAWIVDAEPAP